MSRAEQIRRLIEVNESVGWYISPSLRGELAELEKEEANHVR